jgi:hypothetical protein
MARGANQVDDGGVGRPASNAAATQSPPAEVQLGPTRYILLTVAALNVLLALFVEWPAASDYLMPRSPYGKAPPMGRAGDFIFLASMPVLGVGLILFGGWRSGRALIALAVSTVLDCSVVMLIVGLRLDDPEAYRSILLTVIALNSAVGAVASGWAFVRIRRAISDPGDSKPDPPRGL